MQENMSRPSTCSTVGQSRKLSARTESYDGDTESFTCPGSQMENDSVYFSYNDSLTSPRFPATAREVRKLSESCFTTPSPFSESETETDTSTSNTSVVNYTDSEFCRVKRPTEELVESAEIFQSNEGSFSNSETASWDNRNTTVDDLSTLLYRDSSFKSNEITHKSVNDPICSEANRAAESSPGRFVHVFTDSSMAIDHGSKNNSSEKSGHQRETERREIVKEARKKLRQTRAKRYRNEISSGCKTTSGKQSERAKINTGSEKRTQGNSRSSNLLKQRKRQECFDIEKIQVKHLITELTYLNLNEQAADVKRALTFTEEKEKEYGIQLQEDRQNIKSRKTAEKLHQKQEAKAQRLEQIRRTEAERKEKEAKDRQRRTEEAKKRRERNRMLWQSYHAAVLANSISKSFTFSYFPKLRPQPVERPQTEPQKRTHSAKHQEAHR